MTRKQFISLFQPFTHNLKIGKPIYYFKGDSYGKEDNMGQFHDYEILYNFFSIRGIRFFHTMGRYRYYLDINKKNMLFIYPFGETRPYMLIRMINGGYLIMALDKQSLTDGIRSKLKRSHIHRPFQKQLIESYYRCLNPKMKKWI